MRLGSLGSLVFALAACASPLSQARSQFIEGRYPEAKQTLTALEPESRTWAAEQRATYALFRGLTHAALGDRAQGAVWLREAKALDDAHPGSLSSEDAQRLRVAIDNSDVP